MQSRSQHSMSQTQVQEQGHGQRSFFWRVIGFLRGCGIEETTGVALLGLHTIFPLSDKARFLPAIGAEAVLYNVNFRHGCPPLLDVLDVWYADSTTTRQNKASHKPARSLRKRTGCPGRTIAAL